MSLAITTSYAGEFSGKYIAATLLTGDTLANNEITILPNVRYKSVLQKASTDNIVKDASCGFDPAFIMPNISGRLLSVAYLATNSAALSL